MMRHDYWSLKWNIKIVGEFFGTLKSIRILKYRKSSFCLNVNAVQRVC